jgi:hypothetical protein
MSGYITKPSPKPSFLALPPPTPIREILWADTGYIVEINPEVFGHTDPFSACQNRLIQTSVSMHVTFDMDDAPCSLRMDINASQYARFLDLARSSAKFRVTIEVESETEPST